MLSMIFLIVAASSNVVVPYGVGNGVNVMQQIRCFQCYYDIRNPNIRNSDEECIERRIDEDDVRTGPGNGFCYSARIEEHGDTVSIVRGGDWNTLNWFARSAHRNPEEYLVSTCNSDLCNGTESLATGYVTLIFAILLTLYNSCI